MPRIPSWRRSLLTKTVRLFQLCLQLNWEQLVLIMMGKRVRMLLIILSIQRPWKLQRRLDIPVRYRAFIRIQGLRLSWVLTCHLRHLDHLIRRSTSNWRQRRKQQLSATHNQMAWTTLERRRFQQLLVVRQRLWLVSRTGLIQRTQLRCRMALRRRLLLVTELCWIRIQRSQCTTRTTVMAHTRLLVPSTWLVPAR